MMSNSHRLYLKRELRRIKIIFLLTITVLISITVAAAYRPDSAGQLMLKTAALESRLLTVTGENSRLRNRMDQIIPPCMEEGKFQATAYEASPRSTGRWAAYNKTKTGTTPRALRSIAVDPEVIPLGSLVFVDPLGWFVAEDTGSAIKGNAVDIYMNSVEQAVNFGRKEVSVLYQNQECFHELVSEAKNENTIRFYAFHDRRKDDTRND